MYLDIIIDLLSPEFVHGANAQLPFVGNQISAAIEALDEEYLVTGEFAFEEVNKIAEAFIGVVFVPYYGRELFANEHDIPNCLVGDANHVYAIIGSVSVDDVLLDPFSRSRYGGQRIKLLDDSLVEELFVTDIQFGYSHLNRGMVFAPILEFVELFEHGCADEYEADVAFDHVLNAEQSGISEEVVQYGADLVTGIDFVNDDEGVSEVAEVGAFELSVVEDVFGEYAGYLFLHIGLPSGVAHSGKEADIFRVNDEVVVRMSGHLIGDLDHKTVHTDLGFLGDGNDATVVVFELVDNAVSILFLVVKDEFGCRVGIAFEKGESVGLLGVSVTGQDLLASGVNKVGTRGNGHGFCWSLESVFEVVFADSISIF